MLYAFVAARSQANDRVPDSEFARRAPRDRVRRFRHLRRPGSPVDAREWGNIARMHLILQGADVETTALKEIARASGASGIEQVRPNVFRLNEAQRIEGIGELCARHGLEWIVADEPG
jgi:uncharacterized protein DUF4072